MPAITYTLLDDMTEMERAVDLEIETWGLNPRDAVPAHLMHTVALNGGMAIGAYDGKRMVAISFGLPVRKGKQWVLWSHITGVHPAYQGRNIGFAIKQHQRAWALEHNYKIICWTFDPMQRGNANFNIHRLGASASLYHENYYGLMQDSINAGMPSDRLEVVWDLKAKKAPQSPINETSPFLLELDTAENLVMNRFAPGASTGRVEIPFDLANLKQVNPAAALDWQVALRQSLQAAFANGWVITDFVTHERRCWYVLTAPSPWFMYVLECSDSTLYTGITNNINRRIKRHNQGQGAAYTASRRPVKLLAAWKFNQGRGAALQAEARFKKLPRLAKLDYISAGKAFNEGVFGAFN